MKKMYLLALGVSGLFLLSVNSGCKKSSSSSSAAGGDFTATVNGQHFSATVVTGLHELAGQLIEIGGASTNNGDTTAIEIAVPDSLLINVPYTSQDGLAELNYNDFHAQTDFTANSSGEGHGTVTITAWDPIKRTISGNFSGVFLNSLTLTDSVTVTNGLFSATYTDAP